MKKRHPITALLVVVAALVAGSTCQSRRPPPQPLPPTTSLFTMPARSLCAGDNASVADVGGVADPALREVSGLAASLLNDELLWMVADAGNAPAVFGVSATSGETRIEIVLPVPNVDFEDLALGPCPDLSQPCVFLADTGDNDGTRSSVVVYAFPEPSLATAPTGPPGVVTLDAVWAMPLSFPQGESVDVEALAVFPDATALLLLEKTTSPSARVFAYRAPWTSSVNGFDDEARVLELSGTIAVPAEGKKRERRITGAALHWSGTRLLVRFTGGIVEYAAVDAVAFFDPASLSPRQVLPAPPQEEQGEALTYAADGRSIFSVAEAAKGQIPVLHQSACAEEP